MTQPIFNHCSTSTPPEKKANVVPIHKKGDKQTIKNTINKQTIVQFLFYLFVGEYLNACFMTLC